MSENEKSEKSQKSGARSPEEVRVNQTANIESGIPNEELETLY